MMDFFVHRALRFMFLASALVVSGQLDLFARQHANEGSNTPRSGSGTSWMPAISPMMGFHVDNDDWSFMVHGFATVNHVRNPAPRGADGTYSTSMLMLQATRKFGQSSLRTRVMGSAEPTMGARGYPLLLQTGETADGLTPLVDRQHPHDFIMEMSVAYQVDLTSGHSIYAYLAPVGEPAIGPTAFMHRASAGPNPNAPVAHHFQDGTHITHGVLTVGVITDEKLKLEGSVFNGREPDQDRWDIPAPKFDSYAFRVSVNPSPNWSVQASLADLADPEQLHPGISVIKLIGSIAHHRKLANGYWNTSLVWGRNKSDRTLINVAEARETFSGPVLDHYIGINELPDIPEDQLFILFPARSQTGLLLESLVQVNTTTLFGRIEKVAKDELFDPQDARHSEIFDIGKLSGGVYQNLIPVGIGRLGLGITGSVHFLESELRDVYGSLPASLQVFTRLDVGN